MNVPKCFVEGHYCCGQPTAAQLEALARGGVRTVINLRAPGETAGYDEAAGAGRLGLRYVPFPIAGAEDLDAARVRAFGQVLDDARREGDLLIHCGTSNRVGAMVALDEHLNRGRPLQAALQRGRDAGLASLEPAVVALAERVGVSR